MSLSKKQQKYLSRCAHKLNPVVLLGQNGLTENVLAEIEIALNTHELVKLKLRVGDRALRDQIINDICHKTGAENVQRIGNVVSIYRQNVSSPIIMLPN